MTEPGSRNGKSNDAAQEIELLSAQCRELESWEGICGSRWPRCMVWRSSCICHTRGTLKLSQKKEKIIIKLGAGTKKKHGGFLMGSGCWRLYGKDKVVFFNE